MQSDMNRPAPILLLGESWFTQSVHQKGYDSFTTCTYEEGCGAFRDALGTAGWPVHHIPCHLIETQMPETLDGLKRFSAVVLSDVGSNTFALGRQTFIHGQAGPDRLRLIEDYVAAGGGLLMVGGYLSFSGIEGKARFGRTCLANVLPVTMEDGDDRVERPSGARPIAVDAHHEILERLPEDWPPILGYNRLTARESGTVLVKCDGLPLLTVGEYGRGRVAAFASDMGPHWASEEFLAWAGYGPLWVAIVSWLAAADVRVHGGSE